MNVDSLFPSRFLKQSDIPSPVVCVILRITQEEIQDNGTKKVKPVIHLNGLPKPLVLNRINADTIASLYGDDVTVWSGKSIEVYADASVRMGAERVGGVRVRAPRNNPLASQPVSGVNPDRTIITTTMNGTGAAPLWDISDGQNLTLKQTTEQVLAFLASVLIPLDKFRVRTHGSNGAAITADVWEKQHRLNVQNADPIPF